MLSRAAALTRGSGPTAAAAATTTSSTMFAGGAPWRRGLSCATSARPGWVRARNGRELHRRDLPAAALVAGVRGFSASARAAVSASSSSASGEEGASPSPPPPVFVVFGATGGIGEAVARQLHAVHAGAGIVISGRNESKLSSIAASLPGAVAVPADATDAKAVDAVIAAALKLGPISGVTSVLLKAAHTTSEAEFDDVVKTNLYSAFTVLKSSVKAMMRAKGPDGKPIGGSIVLCSSAVASHGLPNHEAIAAAKAGVVGLAKSAAASYAPQNLRVNCVAPGLTRTPMTEKITGSEVALAASVAMHPLKRVGEAEEVAAAIAFMLDPANSWITGQVLGVDGGLGSIKAK